MGRAAKRRFGIQLPARKNNSLHLSQKNSIESVTLIPSE